MSTRNITRDERILVPGKTYYYGRLMTLSSSGSNQVTGSPLAPHAYSLSLSDEYEALTSSTYCATGQVTDYSKANAVCTAVRSWSASDDLRLYGKLEEAYDKGDFNAAVFTGELGESVNMLADRTKQLAKAVIAAKRGRFAQAAYILGVGGHRKVSHSTKHRHRDDAGPQHAQRISDGWLELQYGWKPLIGDIYTLADQIAKSDKPRSRRLRVSHSIPMLPGCLPDGQFLVTGGGSVSKQIIAYVTEDIPSWPRALGLMDPEQVVWELVPFSFVVDWFIPVGNWIQARDFASRAVGTFVITQRTKYDVRMAAGQYRINKPRCYFGYDVKTASVGWKKYVSLQRTVVPTLPQVPLPSFSSGLGRGSRLANAAALLFSIFVEKKG